MRLPRAPQGKTLVVTAPNEDFLAEVVRRFPDREASQLLVMDANGRDTAQDALVALEEAG